MAPATPTATATASSSPTASATATRANTATATASASSTTTPTATPTPSPTIETLAGLADRAGVFVGAAFVEGRHDPAFRSLLVREFNSTTAGVYWSSTHPAPGQYDFSGPDAAVDIAVANGLRVRGHPLVWGRLALPAYVDAEPDPEALRALMVEHIETIVGRYRGRIAQYDVINEPLTFFGAPGTTGTGLENYVFLRLLGPDYIRIALETAHAADPGAKLFVNEFLVMQPGAKQDRFYDLIRGLVDAGVPLHGVGFQGHVQIPFAPTYRPSRAEVAAAVARFAALGLEVEITELDVTLPDPANQLLTQAEIYGDVFAGCLLAAPRCSGITTWGITDQFTWIRDFFGVDGAPLLFDASYEPKPAYFAVRDVLRQAADAAENR